MNFFSIASGFVKGMALNALVGYTGATVNTYFDTRFATSGSTGAISRCLGAVSYPVITYVFKLEDMNRLMPGTAVLASCCASAVTGSFAATLIGFPIEPDQCLVQLVSGAVSLLMLRTGYRLIAGLF